MSEISIYKQLGENPVSDPLQTITTNLTANQTDVTVASFITPELGFTVIPGGVQRFFLYFLKGSSNHNIDAFVTFQLADSSGNPYGSVISTSKILIGWNGLSTAFESIVDAVIPTTPINETDRMIVLIKVDNRDNQNRSVNWYTENGNYSFVTTSVGAKSGSSGSSGSSGTSGGVGPTGPSFPYYGDALITGGLAINGPTSDKAVLQASSTTKGFIPPRMTGSQAEDIIPGVSETGMLIYSTDGSGISINTSGWWGWNGVNWEKLN